MEKELGSKPKDILYLVWFENEFKIIKDAITVEILAKDSIIYTCEIYTELRKKIDVIKMYEKGNEKNCNLYKFDEFGSFSILLSSQTEDWKKDSSLITNLILELIISFRTKGYKFLNDNLNAIIDKKQEEIEYKVQSERYITEQKKFKLYLVCNYIVDSLNKYNEFKPFREKILISGRRLQKLLYFCNIRYMQLKQGVPLFEDEFYAWPSGPVIISIYYKYIQRPDGECNSISLDTPLQLNREEINIIDEILLKTQFIPNSELEKYIKIEGGPWETIYNEHDLDNPQLISKQMINNYYQGKELFPEPKDVLVKKSKQI